MRELKAIDLRRTYGEKTLLAGVNFILHEKDRIGLIGTNGTGKSTLLRILAGVDTAENQGTLEYPSDYRIAYLSQEIHLPLEKSVVAAVLSGETPEFVTLRRYEEVLLALGEQPAAENLQKELLHLQEEMNAKDLWQLEAQVKSILNQLGVPLTNQPIKTLSGGQQKRAALGQVLLADANLLLLDEPTNHLDIEAITWLEKYLAQYQGTLLMVTHDRYFLDRVANRIFELDQGQLLEIKGNYATYLAEKENLQSENALKLTKAQQLYKKELAWIRAGVQARGTKQQARINRFAELKENLQEQSTSKDHLTMDVATTRLGKKVLRIADGNYQIDGKILLQDFDLLLQAGDRLGIVGNNGVGKTTLLNILAGQKQLDTGLYEIGETVKLAYYTQQMEVMDPEKRMIQYLQEVAEEVTNRAGEKISVPEMLERFLFPRFMHGTLVKKLSGGEKRRLYLLKLLMSQPNVLLLDEPTNDLDIATLTVLEDYLEEFPGSVVTVSHDRYFLDKTVDKLLILAGQGAYQYFYGDMSSYLAQQEHQEVAPAPKKVTPPKDAEPTTEKTKVKLTYMEQKEWATIEEEIAALEEKSAQLKEEMNHLGADFARLQALQEELEANEAALENKMERWEYLSEFA